MIPKKKKPIARDHKPIAITSVENKLFMGIVKGRTFFKKSLDSVGRLALAEALQFYT